MIYEINYVIQILLDANNIMMMDVLNATLTMISKTNNVINI